MIQFNLLPDVKVQFIKAHRSKRLFMTASVMVSLLSLVVLGGLFAMVNIYQKQRLNGLDKDIKVSSDKLKNTPNLNKILTIQNQLTSLPQLHAQKPVVSRLFGYLSQMTPPQLSVADLSIDFTEHTMSFTGAADALSTVNKFVDTLKFTDYQSSDKTTGGRAFSNVVLANFGRDNDKATYNVTLNFDALIFDVANDVTLAVPNTITTRSQTEKPPALFQESAPPDAGESQ